MAGIDGLSRALEPSPLKEVVRAPLGPGSRLETCCGGVSDRRKRLVGRPSRGTFRKTLVSGNLNVVTERVVDKKHTPGPDSTVRTVTRAAGAGGGGAR